MDWKYSSPQSSFWASTGCTWAGPCPSYIGGSDRNTIFQMGSHWRGVEGSPLLTCWPFFFWCIPGYNCLSGLWAHPAGSYSVFHPPVLLRCSPQGCCQWLITQPVSRHKSLHLALLNFMRLMWAQLSILLHKKWSVHKCFWYAWIKIFNMIFWMFTELRLLWTEGL